MDFSTYAISIAFIFVCLALSKPVQEEPVLESSVVKIDTVYIDKPYTEEEIILARLLESECYLNDITDLYWVGSVVLNRINDNRFPSTFYGVIHQEGQFDGVTTPNFKRKLSSITLAASRFLIKNGSVIDTNIVGYNNPKTATDTNHVNKYRDQIKLEGKHHVFHTMENN